MKTIIYVCFFSFFFFFFLQIYSMNKFIVCECGKDVWQMDVNKYSYMWWSGLSCCHKNEWNLHGMSWIMLNHWYNCPNVTERKLWKSFKARMLVFMNKNKIEKIVSILNAILAYMSSAQLWHLSTITPKVLSCDTYLL